MQNNFKIAAIIFTLCCAISAEAADINAGKARAAACQSCHGAAGVSSAGNYPNLAAQPAAYLEAQLQKFKNNSRTDPTMQAIASELSDSDMQNLAAFFAAFPAKATASDANLAKTGKDKAAMCMGCHGEKFAGRMQIPRLASQHPEYLNKQLLDFKQGKRKGGPMNAISQSLNPNDIKEVSAYLAGLD